MIEWRAGVAVGQDLEAIFTHIQNLRIAYRQSNSVQLCKLCNPWLKNLLTTECTEYTE